MGSAKTSTSIHASATTFIDSEIYIVRAFSLA